MPAALCARGVSSLVALLLLALGCVQSVNAATVTWVLSGSFSNADSSVSSVFSSTLTPTFNATITFDNSLVASPSSTQAVYSSDSGFSVSYQAGAVSGGSTGGGSIDVQFDDPNQYSQYSIQTPNPFLTSSSGPAIAGLSPRFVQVYYLGAPPFDGQVILTNLSIVSDPSQFAAAGMKEFRIAYSPSNSPGGPYSYATFNITSATAVPAPAAAWLLASGFACFRLAHRKRAAKV